jgi:hypothetical protein
MLNVLVIAAAFAILSWGVYRNLKVARSSTGELAPTRRAAARKPRRRHYWPKRRAAASRPSV